MMISKADDEQLRQIAAKSPHPGVHAGDLINKPATRRLVEAGLVQNSGGSPSSLGYVSITKDGRTLLDMVDEINARQTGGGGIGG